MAAATSLPASHTTPQPSTSEGAAQKQMGNTECLAEYEEYGSLTPGFWWDGDLGWPGPSMLADRGGDGPNSAGSGSDQDQG
jgi:hypothetical protein